MIGADMAVLPAAYREIGNDLHITPAQLGLISLGVGVTSNVSSLLPALFAGRVSRPHLVAFGCLLWAASAALMGCAQSYHELLIVRAINGLGVGIVWPLLFSLVADITPEASRGSAFGIFAFTQSIGGTIGGWLSTFISGNDHVTLVAGMPAVAGWRVSCFGLCVIGTILGLTMLCFGKGTPFFTLVPFISLTFCTPFIVHFPLTYLHLTIKYCKWTLQTPSRSMMTMAMAVNARAWLSTLRS
jgi:MFS family permease